ncbi:MAG: hypothetical protein AAB881_01185 [Patescibacteria group bacterium]
MIQNKKLIITLAALVSIGFAIYGIWLAQKSNNSIPNRQTEEIR